MAECRRLSLVCTASARRGSTACFPRSFMALFDVGVGLPSAPHMLSTETSYTLSPKVVVGAACGFGVARYWWSITPHVDAHANELLQQIGDTGALVLSLVCLTVGVLVAGPGERAWKASFCGKETPGKASSGAKGSRKTVKIQDRPKKE